VGDWRWQELFEYSCMEAAGLRNVEAAAVELFEWSKTLNRAKPREEVDFPGWSASICAAQGSAKI
jgi:hypothetical protein